MPANLRVSVDTEERPRFSLIRFVTDKTIEEGGADGAILHFLVEYGLTDQQKEEAQANLRRQVKDAELKGAVPLEAGAEGSSFHVLAASREVNRHKGFRFIRFEPTTPERYTVNVERLRGALAGGTIDVDRRSVDVNPHRREAAVVRVTANDRRVAMPWISWLSKRML